jgi:hypothetical protein
MRLGMEDSEEHEKIKQAGEEALARLNDLSIAHVAFKKHGA